MQNPINFRPEFRKRQRYSDIETATNKWQTRTASDPHWSQWANFVDFSKIVANNYTQPLENETSQVDYKRFVDQRN